MYYIFSTGTGSIVAAVKIPAHREPLVIGKPGKIMFDMLHEEHGLDAEKTIMVGDRSVGTKIKIRVPTSSGNHGKPGKSLKKSSMHGKIMKI